MGHLRVLCVPFALVARGDTAIDAVLDGGLDTA